MTAAIRIAGRPVAMPATAAGALALIAGLGLVVGGLFAPLARGRRSY